MATRAGITRLRCVYCGEEVRKARKGEHIIPAAIGGTLTIREKCAGRNVCKKCNNGVLSQLDGELCKQSPVAIAAASSFNSELSLAWDVGRASGSVLVEAKPDFASQCMVAYPQMVFFETGPELRYDYLEARRFGVENAFHVIRRTFLNTFRRLLAGDKKCLHLDRVKDHPAIRSGFKFPPRLFTRLSIADLAVNLRMRKEVSLLLRYVSFNDPKRVFHELNKCSILPPSHSSADREYGSSSPPFRCRFDIRVILRALVKLGVNLLAAYCSRTPVDSKSFSHAIKLVRGTREVSLSDCARSGFVEPAHLSSLAKLDGHAFRLQYDADRKVWTVYSVFFGGKVASMVRICGPNNEPWSRADIVVPLKSRDWLCEFGNVLVPLEPPVFWDDLNRILPWLSCDIVA